MLLDLNAKDPGKIIGSSYGPRKYRITPDILYPYKISHQTENGIPLLYLSGRWPVISFQPWHLVADKFFLVTMNVTWFERLLGVVDPNLKRNIYTAIAKDPGEIVRDQKHLRILVGDEFFPTV